MSATPHLVDPTVTNPTGGILHHPADAVVYAPDLPRADDAHREPWAATVPLTVSVLLHAPAYQDVSPPGSLRPATLQGGVGRDTSEPRHGQVARLSQWDFGLTVGIWRLLDVAEQAGVPVAVALDAWGAEHMPGLAAGVGERAGEVVVRGRAANVILGEAMDLDTERAYIARSRASVEALTGRTATGWFSPERAQSLRTPGLLAEAGFGWFGDWPVDERPVPLAGAAAGLTALPFALETEDMYALYTRGQTFTDYEQVLVDTVDRLVADAQSVGPRFLGLSLVSWVSGQACFADVAERTLRRLASHPDVDVVLPGAVRAG